VRQNDVGNPRKKYGRYWIIVLQIFSEKQQEKTGGLRYKYCMMFGNQPKNGKIHNTKNKDFQFFI